MDKWMEGQTDVKIRIVILIDKLCLVLVFKQMKSVVTGPTAADVWRKMKNDQIVLDKTSNLNPSLACTLVNNPLRNNWPLFCAKVQVILFFLKIFWLVLYSSLHRVHKGLVLIMVVRYLIHFLAWFFPVEFNSFLESNLSITLSKKKNIPISRYGCNNHFRFWVTNLETLVCKLLKYCKIATREARVQSFVWVDFEAL